MKEGDIVVASIQQADGIRKNRPGVFLREVRPYGDLLICVISTQLRHEVSGFDEIISPEDADFASSKLTSTSLIRLGYLITVPVNKVTGKISSISPLRHSRLLEGLSKYLLAA